MVKSKIDIYNTTMSIICAGFVIFSSAAKDNAVLRIVCLVSALALLIGVVVKIIKGGAADGGKA